MTVQCIYGDGPAVARFRFDEGCLCFLDKEQDLCPQHVLRVTPKGSMDLMLDYTVDGAFTQKWNEGFRS